MKNRLAWMFATVLSAVSSGACHITTCEHGSVCGVDDEQAREDSCRTLCDRLVVCGNVDGHDHDSCMSSCFDEYDRAPASTGSACRCVARASCSEVAERHCPGAPPIGGGYGTGSGSTTVTGSGSTTVTGSGTTTVTGSGTAAGGGTVAGSGAGGGGTSGAASSGTGSGGIASGTGGSGGYGGGVAGGPGDAGPATCGD